MTLSLTDSERSALRVLPGQCRNGAGYVPVPVLLLLDNGRAVPVIADDLGLDHRVPVRGGLPGAGPPRLPASSSGR